MYKVLLRCVVTGDKEWYDNCYLNSKIKKNKVILWQGPGDDKKQRYKIVAWQWQGYDKKVSKKHRAINDFVDKTLLSLDIPAQWRNELLRLQREGTK